MPKPLAQVALGRTQHACGATGAPTSDSLQRQRRQGRVALPRREMGAAAANTR
ncbi:hypothetical protein [Rhodovulum visakhapatnamense]|uniref:Uncharacterized protein n=1 Tax=Rhodovulum visakhapatnamense TaxID=364297 RepID=A0ABS1RHL0_9RHOB|nr:hypothetical protein [Rhodovulum visakhapatnamense]MBL3570262.1 hypothetical protein [Rhodovulum visakhapatnamense]MBL3579020.1 hypothetical protein [Rhodovulum visakhapatnamense]